MTLHVRATRHGPVISDIDAGLAALAGEGKAIALAFTGLGDHDATAEALLRVNVAQNWSEFLDALQALPDADAELRLRRRRPATSASSAPASLPMRKSGDGSLPADGASGDRDWTGVMPFEQCAADPQSRRRLHLQRQQRASCPPTPFAEIRPRLGGGVPRPAHPAILRRRDRQAQPRQFRRDAGRHRHRSPRKDLLPFLKDVTPSDERARQALALLAAWDGVMDKDRPEPLIYTAFIAPCTGSCWSRRPACR